MPKLNSDGSETLPFRKFSGTASCMVKSLRPGESTPSRILSRNVSKVEDSRSETETRYPKTCRIMNSYSDLRRCQLTAIIMK